MDCLQASRHSFCVQPARSLTLESQRRSMPCRVKGSMSDCISNDASLQKILVFPPPNTGRRREDSIRFCDFCLNPPNLKKTKPMRNRRSPIPPSLPPSPLFLEVKIEYFVFIQHRSRMCKKPQGKRKNTDLAVTTLHKKRK